MRDQVLQLIEEYKLIAIVRGTTPEQCGLIAKALYDGGIRLMEITYDQTAPQSWQATARVIGKLREEYKGRMLIGAGTVINLEQVEMTFKEGGCFIISPDTDPAIIKRTRALDMVSIPGAFTSSEIKTAYEAGADYVKVFPADSLGVGYIKAIRAPLGYIKMLAVGGINEKNLKAYLDVGILGAGIGGNLVNRKWIAAGEFEKITEMARTLTEVVAEYKMHQE